MVETGRVHPPSPRNHFRLFGDYNSRMSVFCRLLSKRAELGEPDEILVVVETIEDSDGIKARYPREVQAGQLISLAEAGAARLKKRGRICRSVG